MTETREDTGVEALFFLWLLVGLVCVGVVVQSAGAEMTDGALTRSPANPLLVNGPEAYDIAKAGPRVVLREGPTTYRMWYEAVPAGNRSSVGYATSPDGLVWSKQGEVLQPSQPWEGGPDGEVSPNSILLEDGVYRMWYHSFGEDKKRRIGYARSPDGIHWSKLPEPVLDVGPEGSWDSLHIAEPRVFREGEEYILFYMGMPEGARSYGLGLARSADGIHWRKDPRNPVFGEGSEGWTAGWFAGPGIVRDGSVFRMWYAGGDGNSLHYAQSADGIAWTFGFHNPVLSPSPEPGAPDVSLGDSVSAYRDGDEFRILYGGFHLTSPVRRSICMGTIAAPGKGDPPGAGR